MKYFVQYSILKLNQKLVILSLNKGKKYIHTMCDNAYSRVDYYAFIGKSFDCTKCCLHLSRSDTDFVIQGYDQKYVEYQIFKFQAGAKVWGQFISILKEGNILPADGFSPPENPTNCTYGELDVAHIDTLCDVVEKIIKGISLCGTSFKPKYSATEKTLDSEMKQIIIYYDNENKRRPGNGFHITITTAGAKVDDTTCYEVYDRKRGVVKGKRRSKADEQSMCIGHNINLSGIDHEVIPGSTSRSPRAVQLVSPTAKARSLPTSPRDK